MSQGKECKFGGDSWGYLGIGHGPPLMSHLMAGREWDVMRKATRRDAAGGCHGSPLRALPYRRELGWGIEEGYHRLHHQEWNTFPEILMPGHVSELWRVQGARDVDKNSHLSSQAMH